MPIFRIVFADEKKFPTIILGLLTTTELKRIGNYDFVIVKDITSRKSM